MKTRKIILTLLVLTFASPAWATPQSIFVDVNGMVCDFCARALEKVFGKQDGVEDIHVDLETKKLTINMKDGTELSDELIAKLVTDSGYNVDTISRSDTPAMVEEVKDDEAL